MTRKHFQAMADEIKRIQDKFERQTIADAFATVAKQTNSRFDRQRFMEACGL